MFARSQLASFVYTVDVPGNSDHMITQYVSCHCVGISPNNRESAADVPSPEFFMDLTLERSSEIHYGPAINRHRSGSCIYCT